MGRVGPEETLRYLSFGNQEINFCLSAIAKALWRGEQTGLRSIAMDRQAIQIYATLLRQGHGGQEVNKHRAQTMAGLENSTILRTDGFSKN
jgi:hypothetical protein